MKKTFVTFLSPGTFVSEETTKPIARFDIDLAVEMSREITERYDAKPYGFYFTTRTRGEDDLDSKESYQSGTYFLGGRVLTLAQVKKEMPEEKILILNMERNGYKKVVVNTNSWKTVQPLGEKDVVLDLSGYP